MTKDYTVNHRLHTEQQKHCHQQKNKKKAKH